LSVAQVVGGQGIPLKVCEKKCEYLILGLGERFLGSEKEFFVELQFDFVRSFRIHTSLKALRARNVLSESDMSIDYKYN
jgi:hypothetical protein